MDKETLIQRLNEDLAGELGAIVQYITYAAKVTGPCRRSCRSFLSEETEPILRNWPL